MRVVFVIITAIIILGSSRCARIQKMEFKASSHRKPVILIPGVLGSRMQVKLDPKYSCARGGNWFDIWLNIGVLILDTTCWVEDISLTFNSSSKTSSQKPGVQVRIPDFGSTLDFEYLDTNHEATGSPYFNQLVNSLLDVGYVRSDDMKGAPFDWRLTPSISGELLNNLTKLVESNYYGHSNKKVVLIGHSMGNMYIYYFLKSKSLSWKEKFIDSFISINSPYIGSVKALKAIISGEAEGHDMTLSKLKLRTAARTFPSSFMLLPRPSLWPKSKSYVVDTFTKNYTVYDYQLLFEKSGCKFCSDLYKNHGREMGDLSAPNVTVHCIYSTQIQTPEVLIYESSDDFPDGYPDFKMGSGDGTVNEFSSSYCLNWKNQQARPVYDVQFPGNGHEGILNNATLHAYIRKVVVGSWSVKKNMKKFTIL